MTEQNGSDAGGAQTNSLPTPQTAADFSFPVTPYEIQLQFMQRLFETIENRQFAIFESPTGTGKSLSIICGALTWLARDAERPSATSGSDSNAGKREDRGSMAGEPDWVVAFENKRVAEEEEAGGGSAVGAERLAAERYRQWVVATRRREAGERRAARARGCRVGGASGVAATASAAAATKRSADAAAAGANGAGSTSDSDACLVDAYYSDTGASKGGAAECLADGPVKYSEDVRRVLERRAANKPCCDDGDSDSQDEAEAAPDGPPEEPSATKVFYASRTHSQLQQFVREVKRTRFAAGDSRIRCVTLGSRAQLCTSDRARQQSGGSAHSLNEACVEMQQRSGGGRAGRCAFLPAQRTPMLDFKDAVGRRVMDIEELAGEGRRLAVCPYYGARESVRAAHVVALPYNMLLSRPAREAMGLSLKDNVVIVDEAHNLVDTILAIHSVSLDCATVGALLELLQRYFAKYWRRLKGSNTVYIRQAIALLRALGRFMKQCSDRATNAVVSVDEFLARARADHINVFKIGRYLRASRLGRKLNMFAAPDRAVGRGGLESGNQRCAKRERLAGKAAGAKVGLPDSLEPPGSAPSPAAAVAAFESFIECIGNPSRAGARLAISTSGTRQVELKYLLLDPSESFGEICKDARAVVLAGGTMKPANDAIEQLLPRQRTGHAERPDPCRMLDPANARIFAWSHVVAPSHVCAQVVSAGPAGVPLRFALQDQADGARLREAGGALAALCSVVPGGVVVFFPSYALLRRMLAEWSAAGIVGRIAARKPVFAEASSGQAGRPQGDDVLAEYTRQVRAPGSAGAVLLSVVGGRLSEGINFSDELGRAVVMVGVPYPNLASPELVERLEYYESQGGASASRPRGGSSKGAAFRMGARARELYESLCMRAVNQSIGRAIRHRGDYAAIVFLDCRYAEPQIAGKLPAWITGGSSSSSSGGSSGGSSGSSASAKASAAVPCSPFGPALANIASFFKRDFTDCC
ncbi:ATP-dependent DNA helicase chl1 [Coemansia sp. RSA 1285]|nr:ATP-dependent DNA helicase chl1 [Coemansia sp. RSA 1285]